MKFIFFILCVSNGLSQTLNLTLEEAREIALQNHPTIAASNYQAQAAAELKKQLKSSLGPQVSAGLSGAAAPDGGRLALAGVQSSLLISRVGAGTQVSQLLSDFGRTNQLMAAADARAAGQRETVKTSRLQVLIGVDRAYYSLLRADRKSVV